MQTWQLKQRQGLPLEVKIIMSKLRIQQWYEKHEGNVYVSFSGGKDSTVLLDIVRSLYPNVQAVYCDTGLEYPEIKEFVKSLENTVIIKPEMSFKDVVSKYGYPVVSKEQAQYIRQYRTAKSENTKKIRWEGRITKTGKRCFKISEKWKFLVNAPFKISEQCCDIMKKKPFKEFERKTGFKSFVGTMASDSNIRKQKYMKTGCNSFSGKIKSTPLGFWTEQDILNYLKVYNVKWCEVYGVIEENSKGVLKMTNCTRTGCVFCLFGIHLETGFNRIQRLQTTHPKLYNFCVNKLDLKSVLKCINVPYRREKVDKSKYKKDTIDVSCRVDKYNVDYLKKIYGNITNTELIDKLINEKCGTLSTSKNIILVKKYSGATTKIHVRVEKNKFDLIKQEMNISNSMVIDALTSEKVSHTFISSSL
jgi:3'-phosphoadenosine 5'-phosphosulfate sulfotransferase (PAPS reductase)/FAD synthetase